MRKSFVLKCDFGPAGDQPYYDYYQPTSRPRIPYIEKDATINEHIEQMRLSATKALLERNASRHTM